MGAGEVVENWARGSHICWVLLSPRAGWTGRFTGLSQPQPHPVLAVTPPHQPGKGPGALRGEVTARISDGRERQRQALNPGCLTPEFMALRMKLPLGFWVFPLLNPVSVAGKLASAGLQPWVLSSTPAILTVLTCALHSAKNSAITHTTSGSKSLEKADLLSPSRNP